MPAERELALGVLGFLDTPPPRFVRAASRAGFHSVSLRVGGSRAQVAADLSLNLRSVDETEDALLSTGTKVLDVEVLRLHGDRAGSATLRQRTEDAVALAGRFAARHLIVVNEDLDRDACVRALRSVAAVADEQAPGLQVCLEFMAFSATRDLASAADVVRRTEVRSVAVLVDTLHFARTNGRVEELTAAGDVLAPYVQVCGIPRRRRRTATRSALIAEATGRRALPGRGTGAEHAVLRAIRRGSALSLEAPRRGDRLRRPEDRAHVGFLALQQMRADVDKRQWSGGVR